MKEKLGLQFEFNLFNVTNTTSLDVPMDQGQIRQNNACSAAAQAVSGDNCEADFVNYGQIATSNNPVDQQSALARLDQIPYTNGSGKGLTVPLQIPTNAPNTTCTTSNAINSNGCANNAADFGSVISTIGGNRAVTFGVHFTY